MSKNIEIGFDLQGILDALPFYILLIDSKHHILMANKAITIALGKNPDQVIGGYCPKVIHNSDCPIPQCPLEEVVCSCHAVEREFYDPDHKRWISSVVYPTEFQTHSGEKIYVHLTYDISDRQNAQNDLKESIQKLNNEIADHLKAQERIKYLAYHDHLTGLPNRLLFSDRLNQSILLAPRIEGTIGVMFLDLDNFKIVNDAMGHDQGDELLKEVATRLSGIVRKSPIWYLVTAVLSSISDSVPGTERQQTDHLHMIENQVVSAEKRVIVIFQKTTLGASVMSVANTLIH